MPTMFGGYSKMSNNGILGSVAVGISASSGGVAAAVDIDQRIRDFISADLAAQRSAAAVATDVARNSFKRKRDIAPPRPGRSGQGQMTKGIKYDRIANQSAVALRIADLDKSAPHWIIQEIGTAQKANLFRGDEGGTKLGRVATIPAQRGRVISSGLAWASQGRYVPPNAAGGTQNLFPRIGASRAKGSMTIKREIQGQHFIKKGSEAGFREYRQSVLAAARQQFRKGRA